LCLLKGSKAIVIKQTLNQAANEIDIELNNLVKGFYFVEIFEGKNIMKRQKIVLD
jgi:hypothetical protein